MKRSSESWHLTTRGKRRRRVTLGLVGVAVAALLWAPEAHGFGSILSSFNSTYPASSSGNNASCQLCHLNTSGNTTWNEYGWQLRQSGVNFAAVEGLPSMNLGGGTTMLDEINASTQPGWTTGGNNNVYDSGGLITTTQTPPGGIGALDPAGTCGDGIVDTGEDCDGGPCCAADCTFAAAGTACDDGDFCNGAETCDGAGACELGPPPCTGPGETCDEQTDVCVQPECTADADCDDALFCTGTETCVDFACQPGSSPCPSGETCDEGSDTCVPPPNCVTDADCDNNAFCDGVETCDGTGNCQPGTAPCTGPGETCDEGADTCIPPACTTDADCDDLLFCTGTETCVNFTCQPGTSPCAPGDSCNETDGCVPPPPACTQDSDCDNGAYCDGAERCVAGACQTGADPCGLNETCDETTDTCEPASVIVDLDIARFRVTKRLRVGQSIRIKLAVRNHGESDAARPATVVGVQDGAEVYREVMDVSDPPEDGATQVAFPPYSPTAAGVIAWTATLDDDDPDLDLATAVTRVVERRVHDATPAGVDAHDDDDAAHR